MHGVVAAVDGFAEAVLPKKRVRRETVQPIEVDKRRVSWFSEFVVNVCRSTLAGIQC
jgi:hypothetical protein